MSLSPRHLLFSSLVVCALSAQARGQLLVPLEQERFIQADALAIDSGGSDSAQDADQATDFGPFARVLFVQATRPFAVGNAGGEIDTQIQADRIAGSASYFADGTGTGATEGWADGSVQTTLRVVFQVPTSASYTLTGHVSAFDWGISDGFLRNDQGDYWMSELAVNQLINFDSSGLLPAGTYELQMRTTGDVMGSWASTEYASGSFEVALQLTEFVPGQPGCFGNQCPCANDDLTAGCANSTGVGGLLTGSASNSVALDDLVLTATRVPANTSALFYMGDALAISPFFDGKQCAVGDTFRFLGSTQTSTAGGTLEMGPGIAADSGGRIQPGLTWHFHAWYRDPAGPCGTGANLTNLYAVTFTP